ncbi:hypothetical protein [Kangiella shandongensis]|uniref:hypothetical protein n=1 Tax=Kangiella shandongensis TaxID=2763258 RepID=UPI001CC1344E|nr:hypothetical protein [Kangiella shandongensis]
MKRVYLTLCFLLGASLLLWPIGLVLMFFMFDAPGSESSTLTLFLAATILFYPIPVVYGAVMAWKNRTSSAPSVIARYTAIAMSGPLLLFFAILLLDVICGGQFACNVLT